MSIFFLDPGSSDDCESYCCWKESCTTWDVKNPVNHGIKTTYQLVSRISEPSTVLIGVLTTVITCFFPTKKNGKNGFTGLLVLHNSIMVNIFQIHEKFAPN